MEKQPFDLEEVGLAFGGDWCNCIEDVITFVTPKKLAVYCVSKGYKPFPEPQQDDLGIRYGYFLCEHKQVVVEDGNAVERQMNVVAAFGDFNHRPLETLQSTLRAIKKVAWFENRTPQNVAKDISALDEEKAPPVREARAEVAPTLAKPGTRRFRQTSDGSLHPM